MTRSSSPNLERNIARSRVILAVVALVVVYLDPSAPGFPAWTTSRGRWLVMNPYVLAILLTYLCYSLIAHYAVMHHLVDLPRLIVLTIWSDVFLGGAVAFLAEGVSSLFYAFYVFAVVAAGLRLGFRRSLLVTGVSGGLYLTLVILAGAHGASAYVIPPVSLAITGYLVGYLGQQRLTLEEDIRALAAAGQRNTIARDLHDGTAQALAGINLRIESCRELLRRGRTSDALADLGELQASINQEYDALRAYMRALAGISAGQPAAQLSEATRFSVRTEFDGTGPFVDHVLQILREAVSNVRRHAQANSAMLRVTADDEEVAITIDDDGRGFHSGEERPWSIASRVRELGGDLALVHDERPGAHLAIRVPLP